MDRQWQARAESVAGAVFICGLAANGRENALSAASGLSPFSGVAQYVTVDEIPPRHLRGVELGVVD